MEKTITESLFELQDVAYADFQSTLTPGIDREKFIGVRVPAARKLAKLAEKEERTEEFLKNLPHRYYDENLIHGIIISDIKDYGSCIEKVEDFLPYIDNWAVCDIISPEIFKKHRQELLEKIKEWTASEHTYTCRFGIKMLMTHYLDRDYKPEYLEIPAGIRSGEYYVRMMQAWFFATALAKQWDDSLEFILNGRLDEWTHNKTIQKAVESYRISEDRKLYLKTLKR